MTNKRYIDEEIVKALECCAKSKTNNDCEALNCPCFKNGMCIFVDDDYGLQNLALDLINRQKAEIERLKGSTVVNNIMESQRIKREAKANAYKEFAEKLQAFCKGIIAQKWNEKVAPISWSCAYADFIDDIDNLLKEMVGEEE